MLSEKQKRLLFNGRTLNGEFRRGFWKAKELNSIKGAPVLPGLAGLYASGGWQWVIVPRDDNDMDAGLVACVAPNASTDALDALKAVYPGIEIDDNNPLEPVKITRASVHDAEYFLDL